MKNAILLGKTTNKKTMFMIYLGKAIHVITRKSICLVTNNGHYHSPLNPNELTEGLDVFVFRNQNDLEQISSAPYDYLLFDIEKVDESGLSEEIFKDSTVMVITDQSDETISFNFRMLSELKSGAIKLYLVCFQMLYGSKIREKELRSLYEDNHAYVSDFPYYLNLKDEAVFVDNGHNKSLKMKHLSKEFKLFLLELVKVISGSDDGNKGRKNLKLLERGK